MSGNEFYKDPSIYNIKRGCIYGGNGQLCQNTMMYSCGGGSVSYIACDDIPNCYYKQLQASKDDCEKKDNQIKILKEKTLIYHSCKTLIDENTALKQQLGISVEALESIVIALNESNSPLIDGTNIAKTALDKIKEDN